MFYLTDCCKLYLPSFKILIMFEINKLTFKVLPDISDLIINHYSQDFYKKLFGLQGDDIDIYNINRIKMHLNQNWSIGVYEKGINNLVGVSMNRVQEKEKSFSIEKLSLPYELEQVLEFFEDLEADMFDLLQVDNVFYAGMVTVHNMHRRKGIFHKLREASETLAKTAGCKYIVYTPTNEYLCESFSKHGYQVLREINYLDYYSRKHVKIFKKVASPYIKAQLVYKKV